MKPHCIYSKQQYVVEESYYYTIVNKEVKSTWLTISKRSKDKVNQGFRWKNTINEYLESIFNKNFVF